MKIRKDGWDRYAEIKMTEASYCQACRVYFEDLEIVYFAPLDNSIICKECAQVHRVLEPRLHVADKYRANDD